jgi:RHH-type transcriptional regulator, proline utilization regulon repressor / proline dehydrogenase / delta 1-pyrroline-5-carboxylate dehydrogenase
MPTRIEPTGTSAAAETTRDEEAVALAADLLNEAKGLASTERATTLSARRRIAGIVGNDEAQAFTMALTDEVLRISNARRRARRFFELTRHVPAVGFKPFDRTLLTLGGHAARLFPTVVLSLVSRRLKSETSGVVVAADDPTFARHIATRQASHLRTNVNVLGEAILGDREAQDRLRLVIDRLNRADVNYVSVKISSISATINPLAFDETVAAVAERLRALYRCALATTPTKFVNLDMEEYRDLALTTAVFRAVLDEPEFAQLTAGIVLQAYLPDSHQAARELCDWAAGRVARGGASIKVRLVKGANLAMEHVEAELHGWAPAPFATKAEVDASFKALLALVLEPRYDNAVRVGLASHNLFDVAWAMLAQRELLAADRPDRIEFEMLEGMAMAEAAAIQRRVGSVLLYTPVVAEADFPSAIAYLVRRLDENTTPDNYLTAAFDIEPGNAAFNREATKFVAAVAVAGQHSLDLFPRRRQDRTETQPANAVDTAFANEPDTDFVLPQNRRWITDCLLQHVVQTAPPTASVHDVNAAVDRALAAQQSWASTSGPERAALINRVGDVMAAERGAILTTMAHEAGKTIPQGDPEVSEAIDFARYYARSIAAIDRLADGALSSPLGTVVVAPPWNFPYAIATGGVLAALAAGNTVILKPAPQTPLTAMLVAEHCRAAGIPAGALQLVAAPDDDAGQRLITHPGVDAVILTGAYATAQLFHAWKPSLRLHAETSGKNSMIITATADIDLAIKDLVRSAFGHAGQKCSAASLGIIEASVYDDANFQRRLADAVETLRVGAAYELTSDIGPLIEQPGHALQRALTTLEPGETWLVEPRCVDAGSHLWSPGVRLGVRRGSWFARTECFGPVLGLIRAESLDDAIIIQNDSEFGLTAGIHALDPTETSRWADECQAGNLYVNRSITGAIVQRQPFGGWKRSAIGPTSKAGGAHYVASLRSWPAPSTPPAGDLEQSFKAWAAIELDAERDPSNLVAERNVSRYRTLPGGVALRVGADAPPTALAIARAASRATGTRLVVSTLSDETDSAFAARIAGLGVDRVRTVGTVDDVVRAAVHAAGLALDERPLHGHAAIELPRWLREQALSITTHRHGHISSSRPSVAAP